MISRPTHKRYAHVEHYQGFDCDGCSTGIFIVNEKDPKQRRKEIKEYMKLSGAVQMVKIWTARGGECYEEVVI